jgi:hypothetical protein
MFFGKALDLNHLAVGTLGLRPRQCVYLLLGRCATRVIHLAIIFQRTVTTATVNTSASLT